MNIIFIVLGLLISKSGFTAHIPGGKASNILSMLSEQLMPLLVKNGDLFYIISFLAIIFFLIYLLFRCNRDNKRRIQKQQDYLDSIEQINEGLKAAKEKAQEANQLKTRFLENISHELRTPLNSIVGFSELLTEKENLSPDTLKQYQKSIKVNSELLLNLINDIIDLSKIETNQLQVHFTDFDLQILMKDIYEYAERERGKIDNSSIKISLDKGVRKDTFYIKSDETRIRQVFMNLVDNALKFTTSGEVQIGYRLNGDHLLFYVKDTGIGFTEQEYEYIFDSFRQGTEGSNRKYGGAGLGLTLSKGIVENLNGKIWAVSDNSKGSIFYFQIPFIAPTTKENKKSRTFDAQMKEQYNWGRKKILVVEDSNMAYELITKLLKGTGADFILEADGFKAIERCEKDSSIDLVLMDIQLPFIDGYEATRRIKEIRPDLPVIAQTANAMMDDRKNALDAGCEDYIAKPLDRIELAEKINKQLFKLKTEK